MAYTLGIYLLNLFLAFLSPKFDPSLTHDEGLEDGESSGSALPVKQDDEFRPFIRRLPEFKFWHSATRAIAISFICSWFKVFDIPVFWPVLVMYWLILFFLTSTFPRLAPVEVVGIPLTNYIHSAPTNSTHDQVSLHSLQYRQDPVWTQLRMAINSVTR